MSINKRLIIDVGPCEGNDTSFYLRKGFNVISVEANPRTADGLQQRFAEELARGQLTIFNRAAYDVSGQEICVGTPSIQGTVR